MAFLEIRASARFLNPPDARRGACVRPRPECVRLEVAPGTTPSPKPPVRVFLGTEPGQHRAERVFVWSIESHRDPSRVYEIYLMKDLAGFDRRGWTTGFTNYRFAIPHFAGGAGRAIFNDVDEAYCGDPADLFDADLGGHGYLATSDSETSVMLIDCERMAPIWTLESAQRELKKDILARTLRTPGIRGDLPPEWTARDEDFQPGFSKLQHWTTLHTQPWRPVPSRFVYEPNPTGEIWFEMKRAADAAGYQVFTAQRPSSLFVELAARLAAAPRSAGPATVWNALPELRSLVARSAARSLLWVPLGRVPAEAVGSAPTAEPGAPSVTGCDLLQRFAGAPAAERFDGVACVDALEFLPDEDVPWTIDGLFARAQRFVHAVVREDARSETLADGSALASVPRTFAWWNERFEAAGRLHPDVHWTLEVLNPGGREPLRVRDGGVRLEGVPRVWLLVDPECAEASQAAALADQLGWSVERKPLRFGPLARLHPKLLGASQAGLDPAGSAPLAPPWPDVVIGAGRRTIAVALWIRARSRGRTRLVHVGDDGGGDAATFDAVVTPGYAHLWPHPQRVATLAPLARAQAKSLPRAADASADPFEGSAHPRIALLLDASGGKPGVEAARARRIAEDVRAFADRAGGSALAWTGSGLPPEVEAALAGGLRSTRVLRSSAHSGLSEVMAAADALVVRGDDAPLLAEAAASGKLVYIYPAQELGAGSARGVRRWIERRAYARPTNRRGTPQPQQGLEYLCARLIERGIVAPLPDLQELHTALYERGIALPFGVLLELRVRTPLCETPEVARRVEDLLGHPAGSGAPARV